MSTIESKWITLLNERLAEEISAGRMYYDEQAATEAISWIEANTTHTQGSKANEHLKLEKWQKAIIAEIFGIKNPKTNTRQFREVLLVVGRKNGKTTLAAAIAKYIWQKEGGVGARVYCVAPKIAQADLVYSAIWKMVETDKKYKAEKKRVDASKHYENTRRLIDDSGLPRRTATGIEIPKRNAKIEKLALNPSKADGLNPSLVICDEIAAWQGEKGLRQYEVMRSSLGSREVGDKPALILSTTTAGYVNDGIFDELHKRATRWLLGESEETRLLPILYEIDDHDKWDDIDELKKANPNMGVSLSSTALEEEVKIARESVSKKAEFMTKYANLKQQVSSAWLAVRDVLACSGDEIRPEDLAHSYAVAGVDLSQTTDLTAACVIVEKNGVLNVIAKAWVPAERLAEIKARDNAPYDAWIERGLLELAGDNYVDYHAVEAWLGKLVTDNEILPLVIGYDRYSAQYLIQDLTAQGFRVDDVYQGDNLWGVMQELEAMIKDRTINLGDNDLVKAHLLNAAVKMNVQRGRGRLVKISPSLHIDAAAAIIDALCVRQKYAGEMGALLAN